MITYEQAIALKKGNTVYAILDNKIVEGKVRKVRVSPVSLCGGTPNWVEIFWSVKRGTTVRQVDIAKGLNNAYCNLYLTAEDVVAAAKKLWDAQIAEHQRVISLIQDKIVKAEQFEKERSFKEALLKQVKGE